MTTRELELLTQTREPQTPTTDKETRDSDLPKCLDSSKETQTPDEETTNSDLLKCLDSNINDKTVDKNNVKRTILIKDWVQSGDLLPTISKNTPVIKKMSENQTTDDDKMLLKEYNILSELKPPLKNIVAVFCMQSNSQPWFFVMEAGEQSLFNFLHGKKSVQTATGDNDITTNYTMRRCLVWLTQIAEGLAYLHEQNIIHRDVKSDNVLLFECATVCKICDLDLSRPDDDECKSDNKGTGPYMAPEIDRNTQSDYNKTVDCFSFGVLMRECLTREYPKTRNSDVPSESVFGADADKKYEFEEILKNQMQLLLSDDPEERPTFNILIGRFSKLPINESELPKLEPPYVPGVENELTLFSSPKVPSCHRTGRTLFYSVSNPDFDGPATPTHREKITKFLDERSHQIRLKSQSELPNAKHRFDVHSPVASNEFCRIEHIIASDDAEEEQELLNHCRISPEHIKWLVGRFDYEPVLSSMKFTVAKPQNPAEQEANEE